MAEQFRAIFGFEAKGKAGWTESHYSNQTTHELTMTQALNTVPARRDLLAVGCSLRFIRVSDVDRTITRDRDGYTRVFSDAEGGGTWDDGNSNGGTSDYPFVRACVRLWATHRYWRHVYLGGVPDYYWSLGPDADPSRYITRLDAYFTKLRNGGFGLIYKPRVPLTVPPTPRIPTFGTYTRHEFVKFWSRKTGRGFFLPVGRS